MTDQVAHPTQADLLDITDPVGAVDLVDQGPELDTVARAAYGAQFDTSDIAPLVARGDGE